MQPTNVGPRLGLPADTSPELSHVTKIPVIPTEAERSDA